MQEILPDGGVIRKLWLGEHAKYRDHLLRLDKASRHNRFGGDRNIIGQTVALAALPCCTPNAKGRRSVPFFILRSGAFSA